MRLHSDSHHVQGPDNYVISDGRDMRNKTNSILHIYVVPGGFYKHLLQPFLHGIEQWSRNVTGVIGSVTFVLLDYLFN